MSALPFALGLSKGMQALALVFVRGSTGSPRTVFVRRSEATQ
ncbi:MAG TPA: hypothetical protein VGH80_14605 [Xanthomonadaceae bacterium]|jgi:hypothetical protein